MIGLEGGLEGKEMKDLNLVDLWLGYHTYTYVHIHKVYPYIFMCIYIHIRVHSCVKAHPILMIRAKTQGSWSCALRRP